jgi:hypothetical protein
MADESVNVPSPIDYVPSEDLIKTHEAGFKAFWSSFNSAENDIILISSHGRYEFPLDSDAGAELSYVVPPNTYVIETLDVGRLCSTTIDKPLWNLLQPTNRDKFIALLKEKNVTLDSPHLDGIINYSNRIIEPEEYILVLKNFIIYLPTMVVPKRRLLFGDDVFYGGSKIYYKITYRGFGVYHFPPEYEEGAAFPKAKQVVLKQASAAGQNIQLRNIKNFFYKDDDAKKNLFKRMIRSAPHVTNKDVIDQIVTDEHPRIILFSSCGEYYTPTDITKRTNAMKAIQLQRDAIYNTMNAGYTQFLFRNPIVCDFTPNKYFNYVLEKNNSSSANNNNNNNPYKNIQKKTTKNKQFVQKYRKVFFNKKEEYEGKLMFEAQNFDIDLFKNLLTPLELIAFDESLDDATMTLQFNEVRDSIKGDEKNRKLYIDFLAHRAETWYENLVVYVSDADNSSIFNTAYYIDLIDRITALEGEINIIDAAANVEQLNKKMREKQDLIDILESVNLHIQMICWTLKLQNQIYSNIDDLFSIFTKFRAEALDERAKKKAIANAKNAAIKAAQALIKAEEAAKRKANAEARAAQKPVRASTRSAATPSVRSTRVAATPAAARAATTPSVRRITATPAIRPAIMTLRAKPKKPAGKGSVGGMRRKTQKKLKRTLKSKRT